MGNSRKLLPINVCIKFIQSFILAQGSVRLSPYSLLLSKFEDNFNCAVFNDMIGLAEKYVLYLPPDGEIRRSKPKKRAQRIGMFTNFCVFHAPVIINRQETGHSEFSLMMSNQCSLFWGTLFEPHL
jgi:hypothetical protein